MGLSFSDYRAPIVPENASRIKTSNRAMYNLTEGSIILPYKNLTMAGRGERGFRTLSFFDWKEWRWTYTVGGL